MIRSTNTNRLRRPYSKTKKTENISKIEFISNENSYMEQEYESYSVNDHFLVKYYVKKVDILCWRHRCGLR